VQDVKDKRAVGHGVLVVFVATTSFADVAEQALQKACVFWQSRVEDYEILHVWFWSAEFRTSAFPVPQDATCVVRSEAGAVLCSIFQATHACIQVASVKRQGLVRDRDNDELRSTDSPLAKKHTGGWDFLMRPDEPRVQILLTNNDGRAGVQSQVQKDVWPKLCGLLHDLGCYFESTLVRDSVAVPFWELASCLFYADGHWLKIKEHALDFSACAADLQFWIGAGFVSFEREMFPRMDGPKSHHKVTLVGARLEAYVQLLLDLRERHLFESSPSWRRVGKGIAALCAAFSGYILYLADQEVRNSKRNDLVPVRSQIVASQDVKFVEKQGRVVSAELEKAMEALEVGKFFLLNNLFEPDWSRDQRSHFCSNISLSMFNIAHYVYVPGGPIPSSHFVWKTREMARGPSTDVVLNQLYEQLPIYWSRGMKKMVLDSLNGTGRKVSSASFCASLRGIGVFVDNDFDFAAFHCLDGAEVVALVGSGKKLSTFEDFFVLCDRLIAESGVGVDPLARRHSESLVFVPTAGSFQEFYRTAVAQAEKENIAYCSDTWLRFAFQPNRADRPGRFFSRLEARLCRQVKTQRGDNIDAHWNNAFWGYVRGAVLLCRDRVGDANVGVYSVDDKAKIVVGGIPGQNIQSIAIQKKVVCGRDAILSAMDHDTGNHTSIIPSVMLRTNIPLDIGGSWSGGDVALNLKLATTEKSSPFRHAAEWNIKSNSLRGENKDSFLFIFSDGGADHHPGHAKTMMSLVVQLFCSESALSIFSVRCAGGLSYKNPCERVMSPLNYALVGCATSRERIPNPVWEKECQASTSRLREIFSKSTEKKNAWEASMVRVRSFFEDRISRVMYDSKFVCVVPMDSDAQLRILAKESQMEKCLSEMFNVESMAAVDSKALAKNKRWLLFVETHVQATPYSFCVMCCLDPECAFCATRVQKLRALETPLKEMRQLLLNMPFPQMETDVSRQGHYFSFEAALKKPRVPFNAPSSVVNEIYVFEEDGDLETIAKAPNVRGSSCFLFISPLFSLLQRCTTMQQVSQAPLRLLKLLAAREAFGAVGCGCWWRFCVWQ
jgi:hypothetical protein